MRFAFLAAALAVAATHVAAQSYPTKPILFVIPFAAGGDVKHLLWV